MAEAMSDHRRNLYSRAASASGQRHFGLGLWIFLLVAAIGGTPARAQTSGGRAQNPPSASNETNLPSAGVGGGARRVGEHQLQRARGADARRQRGPGQAGLLLGYGANKPDEARRAANYVDKILKGARAGDLPVDQPSVFDLVVNVATLNALGLTIPPSVVPQVTQWI